MIGPVHVHFIDRVNETLRILSYCFEIKQSFNHFTCPLLGGKNYLCVGKLFVKFICTQKGKFLLQQTDKTLFDTTDNGLH